MARKMKDSGIEWIGEIPEDWELTKVKHIGKYINGYPFKPSDWSDSGIPIIRIQNLTGNNCEYNYYNGPKLSEDYLIIKNDYLISWSATLGVYIWHKEIGYLNQHIFKAIPNENIINYNYFYWIANIFIDEIQSYMHGSAMQHVTKGVFDNFTVPLPSKMKEQEKISDILNREVKYVDNIESKITQQIQTLEDYKKSLIKEAVTKGLDKNVEMKDSGIEWIGEIPKHWEVSKVKHNMLRKENRNPGDMKILSVYREYGVIPKDSRDDNHNRTSLDTSNYKYVKPDYLVINKMKAWQGSMGVSSYEGVVSPAYFIYTFTNDSILPCYIHNLFRIVYIDEFKRISGGIREGQWDLSSQMFEDTLIPVPPTNEQEQIVAYLNNKTAKIEEAIAAKQKQLEILEEYKKSLIYEYVTGKKEVEDVGTI